MKFEIYTSISIFLLTTSCITGTTSYLKKCWQSDIEDIDKLTEVYCEGSCMTTEKEYGIVDRKCYHKHRSAGCKLRKDSGINCYCNFDLCNGPSVTKMDRNSDDDQTRQSEKKLNALFWRKFEQIANINNIFVAKVGRTRRIQGKDFISIAEEIDA